MKTAQANANTDNKDDSRIQGTLSVFAQARNTPALDQSLVHDWIAEGITEDQARARVLEIVAQADTKAAPRFHRTSTDSWGRGGADFRVAATDALAMRNGITIKDPHPAARDFERMSLVDIAEASLRAGGISTAGLSRTGVLSTALGAHTTSDFPLILSDLASKSLLNGYQDEPNTAEGWTSVGEIRDFKVQNRVQLSEAPNLEIVNEHGEYAHGTMGESNESYRLYTYGRIFQLTREAMINDDLAAFTRIPRAFGGSARRKELDLVFAILTGNPAMSDGTALFHASHKNLASSGTALSLDSLGAARAAMRKQKGLKDQAVLNIAPRYLIVPAALETTAEQLIASLVDPAQGNDTTNLEFIRRLSLVVDGRLDANSETAWYLASSPAQMETIERGYLDGVQGGHVETQQGFEIDATAFKARLDFGAKALNHRGLYKNPGA